jgi:hypothetical protein
MKPFNIFAATIFFLLTTACAPAATSIPPTNTLAAPTDINGEWSAETTTAEGKGVSLNFSVENDMVVFILAAWDGGPGQSFCGTGEGGMFSSDRMPLGITDFKLDWTRNELTVEGTFESDTSASGTLAFGGDYGVADRADCNGAFDVTWQATKE